MKLVAWQRWLSETLAAVIFSMFPWKYGPTWPSLLLSRTFLAL